MKSFLLLFFILPLFSCQNSLLNEADTAWMIVASCMVMIMTPGLAYFYGGLVRHKSFVSILGQCFFIFAAVTSAWAFIGYSLAFGDSKSEFLGGVNLFALRNVDYNPNEYAPTIPALLFYFYQNKFATITPCLLIGGMAERVRFTSIVILCSIWIIVVYCPIAHWNWNLNGFLKILGVHDFAGGNVVHLSSGTAALVSAFFTDYIQYKQQIKKNILSALPAEKRKSFVMEMEHTKTMTKHGRQVQEDSPEEIQYNSKESTAFVILGTTLLWFGWFGFNAGSALAASPQCILALINSNIAASTGLLTWYVLEALSGKKPSVIGMCVGAVCGLVGITPACGYVPIYASGIIGVFSSLATFSFYKIIEKCKYRPDDRLGVFGCHGISGITGSILIGFFAEREVGATMNGIFSGGGGRLLGIQIAGICCSFAWSFVVTFIILLIMYALGLFKTIDEKDDKESEDFDEQAVFIPDFTKILMKYGNAPNKEFQMIENKIGTTGNIVFDENKESKNNL